MFRYIHKNKLKYNEGQLAPFFIVILVIIIILALVTINLGKVAFIRTGSTNAVDSGALSAGSVMAGVFNSLASANAEMEEWYWTFLTAVSVSYVIAFLKLGAAYGQACPNPCGAQASIDFFINTTWAILVATSAHYAGKLYYYGVIRRNTREGRESAVGGGHSYAFTNSGLASKLKEGAPPGEVTGPGGRRNYRDTFDDFLDAIHDDVEAHHPHQHYTYDWEDGQERAHIVEVDVSIDDVEDYDLIVSALPFPAEIALLSISLSLAYSASAALKGSCACRSCCSSGPWGIACCVCWLKLCVDAMVLMTPIFWLMGSALAGLAPILEVHSSSTSDAWPWMISWIDDIDHDRLVRVEIDQQHEGADLGLWQTRYPDIRSFSLVSFRGTGEIHEPKFEHDASIIETD